MRMSDLPSDMVEEILSRVPATTLKRLRPTCKRWNALSKDRGFTEKHHRKAAKQSLLLMLKEFRVFPMSVDINLSDPSSIEFKGALGLNDYYHSDSRQVDIAEVFHCDGLLLCITKHNRLVVWNPCSGETKWIHAKTRYKKYSRFALGYQNNKSNRRYKILTRRGRQDTNGEFEIYEFISDSWRVLDDIALDCFIHGSWGVSLKGNTYWVATDRRDDSIFLICFDFTTERFRRLNLPPLQSNMSLSLVREEQLSVLHQSYIPSKIELWVTNNKFDNEAELSWSRCFTDDLRMPDRVFLLFVCCEGSCWHSRNEVYIIGEDDEYYTEITYAKSTIKSWRPLIFSYVPSLVRIQQGKRKE